ncbi:MAG TPA: hypothetical protein VJK72_05960, partial [Candidatus Nanoarchaeia archaeon]|nr:hypothetical protein [Candidatus Nanoarchaeia archaeon]
MTLRLFQSKYFDTETLKVVLLYLFLGGFILSVHYFIFVEKAEASIGSGACSWHNGVDCNAGSDGDGSVICHDGWRDSSVGFYSVCDKGCPYGFTDEYNKRILD